MDNIISIITVVLGAIITVTIYLIQESRRRGSEAESKRFREKFEQLEERNRTDAWHLYRTCTRLSWKTENLKGCFDKVIGEGKVSELNLYYGLVGEMYGIAAELTRYTIRFIKQSEVEFSEATIDRWANEKKIPSDYQKELFKILLKS